MATNDKTNMLNAYVSAKGGKTQSTMSDKPNVTGTSSMRSKATNVDWNNPENVKSYIVTRAKQLGVPDSHIPYILAIGAKESGFKPNSHNKGTPQNPENSYGIFQINTSPNAHPNYTGGLDPVANTDYAIKFFESLVKTTGGDMRKAVARYNGSGRDALAYANDLFTNYLPKYTKDFTGGKIRLLDDASMLNAVQNAGNFTTDTQAMGEIPMTREEQLIATLGEAQRKLAEAGRQQYLEDVKNDPSVNYQYDEAMYKKLQEEREKQGQQYLDEINKLQTTATPEQIAENAKYFAETQAEVDRRNQEAIDYAKTLGGVNQVQAYADLLDRRNAELAQANPYTQIGQMSPMQIQELANRVRYDDSASRLARANAISRGYKDPVIPQSTAQAYLAQAQAQRDADIARQTGLTAQEYLAGQNMNYVAQQEANKQVASLLPYAMQGDARAQQMIYNIMTNGVSNYQNNRLNQITQQNALSAQNLADATLRAGAQGNVYQANIGLAPNVLSADANIQGRNQAGMQAMYQNATPSVQGMMQGVSGLVPPLIKAEGANQIVNPVDEGLGVYNKYATAIQGTGNVNAINQISADYGDLVKLKMKQLGFQ